MNRSHAAQLTYLEEHPDRRPAEGESKRVPFRAPRPHIVIAGPEKLTLAETGAIRNALEDRKARVSVFRMTDEFRMPEFRDAVEGSAWVLIAVDEYPGRELELLRIVEQAGLPRPNVGIICLEQRVNVSNRLHVGGRLELLVKRTPGDRSLSSSTRARDMVLVRDLADERETVHIARVIIPNVPD